MEVVHVNTGLLEPTSDHDPLLARIDLAAVPEPGHTPLVATGLLVLLLIHRRERALRQPFRAITYPLEDCPFLKLRQAMF